MSEPLADTTNVGPKASPSPAKRVSLPPPPPPPIEELPTETVVKADAAAWMDQIKLLSSDARSKHAAAIGAGCVSYGIIAFTSFSPVNLFFWLALGATMTNATKSVFGATMTPRQPMTEFDLAPVTSTIVDAINRCVDAFECVIEGKNPRAALFGGAAFWLAAQLTAVFPTTFLVWMAFNAAVVWHFSLDHLKAEHVDKVKGLVVAPITAKVEEVWSKVGDAKYILVRADTLCASPAPRPAPRSAPRSHASLSRLALPLA
jgi:hypothetical protein